ncbi:MAG: endonuclease/exonuclease/phosphatase family protein [Oligoflexales bacterium]|nr:endonuclease/exonuclease/phosphatase family protein [Oligoflexales bacterium]
MVASKLPIKPKRPKRSYRAVIENLSKVWRVKAVEQESAIWQFGTAALPNIDSQSIKICVWNIFKGSGGHRFQHDFRRLLNTHDLFLVQEALFSEHSLRLYYGYGVEVLHAASYQRSDGLRDGVMTLTKSATFGKSKRIICKYPEPILKTPKVALVSYHRLSGSEEILMVVNIHATLFRTVKRAVVELENLLEQLPEHFGPVIIAGDFNTFTSKYFNAVKSKLENTGMEYVSLENDHRSKTSALDQVFIKKLSVFTGTVDFSIASSDHFPLTLELKFL